MLTTGNWKVTMKNPPMSPKITHTPFSEAQRNRLRRTPTLAEVQAANPIFTHSQAVGYSLGSAAAITKGQTVSVSSLQNCAA